MAQAVSHVAPTHATIPVKARPVALMATIARAERHALLLLESAATRYVLVHCRKYYSNHRRAPRTLVAQALVVS